MVYLLTWVIWGKTELLDRGLARVWVGSAVQTYLEQYDGHFVFATTPPYPREVQRPDGEVMVVRDLDPAQLYNTFEQINTPMVAAFVDAKYWNPGIVHSSTGYWLVGSDHIVQSDEWLLWAFTTWVTLWRKNDFRHDTF